MDLNTFSDSDSDESMNSETGIQSTEAQHNLNDAAIVSSVQSNQDETAIVPIETEHHDATESCVQYNEGTFSLRCIRIKSLSNQTFFVPLVEKPFEPKKNQEFDTLEEAIEMYKCYSLRAGFDYRLGGTKRTKGVLIYKSIYCSREGETDNKYDADTLEEDKNLKRRKRSTKRMKCQAFIRLRQIGTSGRFLVSNFFKVHNHELFTDETDFMSRQNRELSFSDKGFIFSLSSVNIGATKSHAIMSSLRGGVFAKGPTCVDYKNFARDLNCYIGDSDATLFMKLLGQRKKHLKDFTFEYIMQGSNFNSCFWADGIAKRNYVEFGDVMSFDATYRTNKYSLIFVPFTGIDNHKRCVTFGAALLGNETIESYVWLLKTFLKVFEKQPSVVVTDQDPALIRAVNIVFKDSTHRLCMWHIGKKLVDKVCPKILTGTDFKDRMQKLIWNPRLDSNIFEEEWNSLIKEFSLEDNKWLSDMYNIREIWIPAFFKGTKLSGLMRTTSLSESQNFFFQSFMKRKSNLMNFMLKFDTAMDKQRNKQASNDYTSVMNKPSKITHVCFEVQAADHYTLKTFSLIQDEIFDSVYKCTPAREKKRSVEGNELIYVIERPYDETTKGRSSFLYRHLKEDKKDPNKEFRFKVTVNEKEDSFKCSCMLFEHFGMLCRHILCVFRIKFKKEIPSKYLLRRWQKNIIQTEELRRNYSFGEVSSECVKSVKDIYSMVSESVSLASNDGVLIEELVQLIANVRNKVLEKSKGKEKVSKSDEFDLLIGVSKPETNEVLNPVNVRTKGCGSSKRMKTQKEIAMDGAKRRNKTCNFCKKTIPPKEKHDYRNCPDRIRMREEAKAKALAQKAAKAKET